MLYPNDLSIHTVDLKHTGRPNLASCHILKTASSASLVEVGATVDKDHILLKLAKLDIKPEQIEYIIVTHIHLDHAGAAGHLLNHHFPNAKLIVHEKGAKHLIDPTKLIAGALAVYGQEYLDKTYGSIEGVDEKRILSFKEGSVSLSDGPTLDFFDTPGHARHHFCFVDRKNKYIFTGDTFGLAYPELTNDDGIYLFPTTTPTAFEPEAMKGSIQKIVDTGAETAYLTHFGPISNPKQHQDDLLYRLNKHIEIAKEFRTVEAIKENLKKFVLEDLNKRNQKNLAHLMDFDIGLNAQGLAFWIKRQEKSLA